jgi:hypothetical protein
MKLFLSKGIGTWLSRLIVAVLATIPTVYLLWRIRDPEFIDSAMGNWFATMIGALVGIGIALELYRWQEGQGHKARRLEERDHTAKILALIREELIYNRDQLLSSKVEADGHPKRVVFAGGLKDELWNALSDGGELQWIRDLQLMYAISLAYHYVRRIIFFERRYLEIMYSPASPMVDTSTPRNDLAGLLLEVDSPTQQYINNALQEIEKSIVALENAETA